MATMQQQAHGAEDHPTPRTYVIIAVILSVITIIEVAVVIIDLSVLLVVPALIGLSAVKFAFVIGYFMHLKFDARLYQALFLGGLFLAIAVLLALVALFDNFTLPAGV